jgi:membrane-associated phospholipid phosphatase
VLYAGYDATRGLRHGTAALADRNGSRLLAAEKLVHLDPEHALNQALWRLPVLAVACSYFYATLHFLVTPAVLIWLYRRHPRHYGRARSVLALGTLIALVGFWLYPATPPRLLPGAGIRDTLADVHQWGWWSGQTSAPHGLGNLANEFAAMPSLHIAWSVWAGWLLLRHSRRRVVRVLGAGYPLLTALVVMSTGNHYVLDVLAGAAVIAFAAAVVLGAARWLSPHLAAHPHERGDVS